MDRPGDGFEVEVPFVGVVESFGGNGLVVVADDGARTTITYDLGGFALPVAIGQRVRGLYREVRVFGTAHALALWDDDDRPLLIGDDGGFGSGWSGYIGPTGGLPDGFAVTTELVGCPVEDGFCGSVVRLGLRFAHGASSVAAAPGDSAVLAAALGDYRVVNAYAEMLGEVRCTDMSARVSWLILAEP